MNDQRTNKATPAKSELPDGVRTLVSLVLFVHLFALAVTVVAHTGQSELTDQIRRRVPLLQPYLRRVWMDHAYTYSDYMNPGHNTRLDTQYVIEVEYEFDDGTTERVQLPDDSARPATRRRCLMLARNLAATVGDDLEAEYASMVAAGLLAEEPDATSLRLACVERFTPSAAGEPPDEPNAVRGDDGVYSVSIYRCQAWINDKNGEAEIRKLEESRRLAPVTKNTPKT